MGGIKRTIIAKRHAIADNCFDGRGYSDFPVKGMLIKYQWLGLTWYRIKTYTPRVAGDYDGCYASRYKLRSYASAVRQELKQILYEYKYGCT